MCFVLALTSLAYSSRDTFETVGLVTHDFLLSEMVWAILQTCSTQGLRPSTVRRFHFAHAVGVPLLSLLAALLPFVTARKSTMRLLVAEGLRAVVQIVMMLVSRKHARSRCPLVIILIIPRLTLNPEASILALQVLPLTVFCLRYRCAYRKLKAGG